MTDPVEIIEPTNEMLDKVAEAIASTHAGKATHWRLDATVSFGATIKALTDANCAIADLSTHVIVPREATDGMCLAGLNAFDACDYEGDHNKEFRDIWCAMINHKNSARADESKPKTWPARKPNWMA